MNKSVPHHLWTIAALAAGIVVGGTWPAATAAISTVGISILRVLTTITPVLIFCALSPAVAVLTKRGLAGRFALSVVAWYVASVAASALFGVVVSSLWFGLPLSSPGSSPHVDALRLINQLGWKGASIPVWAIAASVVGIVSSGIQWLFRALERLRHGVQWATSKLAYVFAPLTFVFAVMIGQSFGAKAGLSHYLTVVFYTLVLCSCWSAISLFVVSRLSKDQPVKRLVGEYVLPVAVVAASTSSSVATFPFNLDRVKSYGVRSEVADFVIPFGVMTQEGSAMAYLAYGPLIGAHFLGLDVTWVTMLLAYPAVLLFALASPGLPAGVGTAVWKGMLFASLLGLDKTAEQTFLASWVALASGIPDMIRTAVNVTSDGLTAIYFNESFERSWNARR